MPCVRTLEHPARGVAKLGRKHSMVWFRWRTKLAWLFLLFYTLRPGKVQDRNRRSRHLGGWAACVKECPGLACSHILSSTVFLVRMFMLLQCSSSCECALVVTESLSCLSQHTRTSRTPMHYRTTVVRWCVRRTNMQICEHAA